MMIGASIVAMGLLPVGILMGWDSSFSPRAICWAVLVLLACSIAAWSSFCLRFELAGTANKSAAGKGGMLDSLH